MASTTCVTKIWRRGARADAAYFHRSAGPTKPARHCTCTSKLFGEFYKAIAAGFKSLAEKLGEKELFNGDPGRQVGPEYYYSGGGEIIRTIDLKSSLDAIELISEQGEGAVDRIYDDEGELSHFYRFDQINRGQYYNLERDKAGEPPTGGKFAVAWEEVYPIVPNAKLSMYPAGSELHAKAVEFNEQYANFLRLIEEALNGRPDRLNAAFASMFRIKQTMLALIRNPLPCGSWNAAPTFEVNLKAKV